MEIPLEDLLEAAAERLDKQDGALLAQVSPLRRLGGGAAVPALHLVPRIGARDLGWDDLGLVRSLREEIS